MGKGDMRTRRGKIFRGSYGKTRPRLKNTAKGSAKKNLAKSSQKATK